MNCKVKFQQQVEKGEIPCSEGSRRHRQRPEKLLAQSHNVDSPKSFARSDLKAWNMFRPSCITSESQCKMVEQTSGLNRAILDQKWGGFKRQLDCKVAWNGAILLALAPHDTSRTCTFCGHTADENRRTQAQFRCDDCDCGNHADVAGANSILSRGAQLWRGGRQDWSGVSLGCSSVVRIAF